MGFTSPNYFAQYLIGCTVPFLVFTEQYVGEQYQVHRFGLFSSKNLIVAVSGVKIKYKAYMFSTASFSDKQPISNYEIGIVVFFYRYRLLSVRNIWIQCNQENTFEIETSICNLSVFQINYYWCINCFSEHLCIIFFFGIFSADICRLIKICGHHSTVQVSRSISLIETRC